MRAVEGLSSHIDAGETVAIPGESGCGKSVTSMSILRLVNASPSKVAGSVFSGLRHLEFRRTCDERQGQDTRTVPERSSRVSSTRQASTGGRPLRR